MADATIELQTSESLSDMAYRAILGMLQRGELAPNDLLTERQIAAQLKISRTPLREAVRRLEGERLLNRQRNGALMVRPLPLEEYIYILNVRRLLEGEAASLAAGQMPRAQLMALKKQIEEVRQLSDDAPIPDLNERDIDLHAMIANACGNPILRLLIEDMRRRTSMFRFGRLPDRRNVVCDEHAAIIEALLKGDAHEARIATQAHIDGVKKALLEGLGAR